MINNDEFPKEITADTEASIKILKKIKITKTSQSGNVLVINAGDKPTSHPNPYLINAVVKSHYWNKLLLEGKAKSTKELQELENLKDPTYIRDVLNLKFLPPNLTEQILNGTQPRDLSVQKLFAL